MIILFPIGGIGKRFRDEGYSVPKPLLNLGKKTLIEHVLDCYPKGDDICYKFIITRELSQEGFFLSLDHYVLQTQTKGPVESILRFESIADSNEDILICDCDSIIHPDELNECLNSFRESQVDGGVTIRKTNDPHCSYAKIKNSMVLEIREKDSFTEFSTTGPYWWKSSRQFLESAWENYKNGQYFIAPCYNHLISEGGKVLALEVESFKHLGTPEAFEEYAHYLRSTLPK